MEDYGVEETEGVEIHELKLAATGEKVGAVGITDDGHVYLNGDFHPQGSFTALLNARLANVPYVPLSAVYVLFPAEWLIAECLHDADRIRAIHEAVRVARGAA